MPVNDPQGLRTGAAVSYGRGRRVCLRLADRLGVCRRQGGVRAHDFAVRVTASCEDAEGARTARHRICGVQAAGRRAGARFCCPCDRSEELV